jgi:hypothetical protein
MRSDIPLHVWRSRDSTPGSQRVYTRCVMSQTLRLLTDEEFSALTTDEKFNYLNEVVSCLLGDRAKAAQEAAARHGEARPAELRDAQGAPEQL